MIEFRLTPKFKLFLILSIYAYTHKLWYIGQMLIAPIHFHTNQKNILRQFFFP